MSKLNISVFPFAFAISACQQDYVRPEFISMLVENKPFFTLMNSISVCLLTKNVTLNLMDLTRRHIFKLFFYGRLWMSSPKLLGQLRGEGPRHRSSRSETKLSRTKWQFHLWNKKRQWKRKHEPRGRGTVPPPSSARQEKRVGSGSRTSQALLLLPFLFPNHSKLGRWRLSTTDSKRLQEDIWYFFLIKDDRV